MAVAVVAHLMAPLEQWQAVMVVAVQAELARGLAGEVELREPQTRAVAVARLGGVHLLAGHRVLAVQAS